jgi:hypothetical protein
MPASRKRKMSKPAATQLDAGDGADAVDGYIKALTHPLKAEIEALRQIILKTDDRITEGIKWNVPSFHCGDWFATFDLRSKEWVQIILHRGSKPKTDIQGHYVQDPKGILKWITNDRCVVRFGGNDVVAKAPAFRQAVADWVGKMNSE